MNSVALVLPFLLLSCASSPAGKLSLQRSGEGPGKARALIWTASVELGVETEAFESTVVALSDLSRSLGGYPEEQSIDSIVLRVPAARLDEALAGIGKQGEPIARSISAQDVTMLRSDLRVRVDNLKRLQARLRELAAQGANVHELLEVEKEMARVTSELEVLEAQLALIEQQVALASIRVRLIDEATPGPVGWVFYALFVGVKWLFVWE